jgi:hypothetical protein
VVATVQVEPIEQVTEPASSLSAVSFSSARVALLSSEGSLFVIALSW